MLNILVATCWLPLINTLNLEYDCRKLKILWVDLSEEVISVTLLKSYTSNCRVLSYLVSNLLTVVKSYIELDVVCVSLISRDSKTLIITLKLSYIILSRKRTYITEIKCKLLVVKCKLLVVKRPLIINIAQVDLTTLRSCHLNILNLKACIVSLEAIVESELNLRKKVLELELNCRHTLINKSLSVWSSCRCCCIDKILATIDVLESYKTCTTTKYSIRSIKIPIVAVHWRQCSKEIISFRCPVLSVRVVPVTLLCKGKILILQHNTIC